MTGRPIFQRRIHYCEGSESSLIASNIVLLGNQLPTKSNRSKTQTMRRLNRIVILLVAQLAMGRAFQSGTTLSIRLPAAVDGPRRLSLTTVPQQSSCDRLLGVRMAASTAIPSSNTKDESTKKPFPLVLWRFARPHTIIGSALAIPALHILAAPTYAAGFSPQSLLSISYATIPALLMNLYITGLNQITDVDIDKINKPNLPIAAGDLSIRNGIITVIVALVLSLAMGLSHPILGSQGLNVALWCSGILGTLYSLPPFRLKRFPFLAAFCIVAVRGAVINAGFFAHAKAAAFGMTTASGSAAVSSSVIQCLMTDPRCWYSSLYFAIFGVVIALMKDVPDVKGDALSKIRTFSVRLGPHRVFQWMHQLLSTLFLGVAASFIHGAWMGMTVPPAARLGRIMVGIAATLAAWSVRKEAKPVNPEDPKQVYGYYMHLWKLFYLSYLVLPLAR